MDDEARFNFLFANEGNIKRIWQFIYLSFVDNEQLQGEKYKHQRGDFGRINEYQCSTGLIDRKDKQRIYKLFRICCLKDKVFSAFMNRKKSPAPASKQEEEIQVGSVVITGPTAMDVTSEYKLPRYTPTEELMDNLEINALEFASKLDSFKVDRISMD